MPNFPTLLPSEVVAEDAKDQFNSYLKEFQPVGSQYDAQDFEQHVASFPPIGVDLPNLIPGVSGAAGPYATLPKPSAMDEFSSYVSQFPAIGGTDEQLQSPSAQGEGAGVFPPASVPSPDIIPGFAGAVGPYATMKPPEPTNPFYSVGKVGEDIPLMGAANDIGPTFYRGPLPNGLPDASVPPPEPQAKPTRSMLPSAETPYSQGFTATRDAALRSGPPPPEPSPEGQLTPWQAAQEAWVAQAQTEQPGLLGRALEAYGENVATPFAMTVSTPKPLPGTNISVPGIPERGDTTFLTDAVRYGFDEAKRRAAARMQTMPPEMQAYAQMAYDPLNTAGVSDLPFAAAKLAGRGALAAAKPVLQAGVTAAREAIPAAVRAVEAAKPTAQALGRTLANETGAIRLGPAAEEATTKRYYHGTGAAFDTPGPEKFTGTYFGRAYHLSSNPEYSAAHAAQRFGESGLNLRAVDVPADVRLFDVGGRLTPAEAQAISRATGIPVSELNAVNFSVYEMLRGRLGGAEAANAALRHAGFDGIRYSAGPAGAGARGAAEALAIFPESLPKIRNAISGTPMGSAPEIGGAIVGGLAAPEGETPEETLKNRALGIATGAIGGYALRKGVKPGLTVEAVTDRAPTYYSQLDRVLALPKAPNKAGAEAYENFLKAQGVKDEELRQTGIKALLDERKAAKQPLTRQELQEAFAEGQVQVEEVVKGDRLQEQGTGGQTKFSQYQLPGAEPGSYRELLLTMPNRQARSVAEIDREMDSVHQLGNVATDPELRARLNALQEERNVAAGYTGNAVYTSPHWSEPNVLAHVRFNDRVIDGKRTLFIEEIQSDWHQAGRQKGYQPRAGQLPDGFTVRSREDILGKLRYFVIAPNGNELAVTTSATPEGAIAMFERAGGAAGSVPNAPFKKSWPTLALRRMVKWAADNGYEQIAWTTGMQQAERYDLRKMVDSINWTKGADGTVSFQALKDGGSVASKAKLTPEELRAQIGKDAADRITASPESAGELTGDDLAIGAGPMQVFYDRELVNVANDLGKRYGARVSTASLGQEAVPRFVVMDDTQFRIYGEFETQQEAERTARQLGEGYFVEEDTVTKIGPSVHVLSLPPAMQAEVKAKGFPLFSPPELGIGLASGATGYDTDKALEQQDWGEMAKRFALGAGGTRLARTGRMGLSVEDVTKGGKAPWQMTRGEFTTALKESDPYQWGGEFQIDWGPRRGQGRRAGGNVGAMSDMTVQGKKTYYNAFQKLTDVPEQELRLIKGMEPLEQRAYLEARAAGLSHDDAMLNMFASDPREGVDAHRRFVEQALSEGKPVPPEVLADYPDVAAKYGKAPEPVLTPPAPVSKESLAASEPANAVPTPELTPALRAPIGEAPALVEQGVAEADITPLLDRYTAVQDRLDEIGDEIDNTRALIEVQGQRGGAMGIEREGKFVGWTDEDIRRFAAQEQRDPTVPDWADALDPVALKDAASSRRFTEGRTAELRDARNRLHQLLEEEKALARESADLEQEMRGILDSPVPTEAHAPTAVARERVSATDDAARRPWIPMEANAPTHGVQAPMWSRGEGGMRLPPTDPGAPDFPVPGMPPPMGMPINVGPTKSAGLRQLWDRAINTISRQGRSGKELAAKVEGVRDTAEKMAGEWEARLPTARHLSKAEFDNFIDVVEGKAQATTAAVARAAEEWGDVAAHVWRRARRAGLDIGYLEKYFPHVYDPSVFQGSNFFKAVNHLVATGQAKTAEEAAATLRRLGDVVRNRRYGNLELPRNVDLPDYQRTKEAMLTYIESSARRIAHMETFGKNDVEAMRLLNGIRAEGFDADAAQKLFDKAVGAAKYGTYQQKASSWMRSYNVITKLGLGALANATQSVNTASVVGLVNVAKNAARAVFSKEATEEALKAGVLLDSTLKAVREGGGWEGKLGKIGAPGFNQVEAFNRTLAYHAGRDYAQSLGTRLAQGNRDAEHGLRKLGLDIEAVRAQGGKLTDEQLTDAGRKVVLRTQFKVDPQDLPGWASSPGGKLVMQFRTFSYNQTAFVWREILEPAMRGNVKPLAAFLLLGIPVGMAKTELANALRNQPSEENPAKRTMQYVAAGASPGIIIDVIRGLFPMNSRYLSPDRYVTNLVGTIGGPTLGTVAEGIAGAVTAAQGNGTGLERFGLKQIPLVGPTIKNTLLPYKPGGRGGTNKTPVELYEESQRRISPAEKYERRQVR